jgi:hypothetical protein
MSFLGGKYLAVFKLFLNFKYKTELSYLDVTN